MRTTSSPTSPVRSSKIQHGKVSIPAKNCTRAFLPSSRRELSLLVLTEHYESHSFIDDRSSGPGLGRIRQCSFTETCRDEARPATNLASMLSLRRTIFKSGPGSKSTMCVSCNYPASALPAGTPSRRSQVLGRGVILPIAKGEFILSSKLAPENAGAGLPSLIPPGMRAVSVRVNEVVSVAGFVGPGTRVDVLLTGTPNGSNEDRKPPPFCRMSRSSPLDTPWNVMLQARRRTPR